MKKVKKIRGAFNDYIQLVEISAGYGWLGEVKEGIDEGKDKMDVTDDEGLGWG